MLSGTVIATIVAAALTVAGVIGIVVPVLPGSILIVAGLLVAGFALGGWAWLLIAPALVLVVAGAVSSYLLSDRTLRKREIPTRVIVLSFVGGVVGIFVVPVLGFLVGFVIALFLQEWLRLRDAKQALSTTWAGVKAVGLGMLIELTTGITAVLLFAAAIVLHFAVWHAGAQ